MGQRIKRIARESVQESPQKRLEGAIAAVSDASEDLVLTCQKACLDGTHIVAQVRNEAGGPVLSMR